MTAREQLEAAIWDRMRRFSVTTTTPGAFVDEVLRAAEAYAAGDSEDVTLRRRQILDREQSRRKP